MSETIKQLTVNRQGSPPKLTEERVREIRESSLRLKVLAAKFGVSISAIHHVKSGRTWRWLGA